MVVLVPDQPGELARLLHDVGDAGVNLEDLHLEHGLGQPFGLAEVSVLPAVAARLADELHGPRLAPARLTGRRPRRVAAGVPATGVAPVARLPIGLSAMSSEHLVVAIDGPSGSGKSSVSRAVARELGIGYLDTGAMYRAVTWWCLEEGVDLDDADAVAARPRATSRWRWAPTRPTPACGSAAATIERRRSATTRVSEVVSKVATNLEVRPVLQQLQRDLIDQVADADRGSGRRGARHHHRRRPRRRRPGPAHGQRARPGCAAGPRSCTATTPTHAVEATRDQIVRRDADDSTVSEFTEAAEGVHLVDTSDLDFEQSVAAVLDVVRREAPARGRRVTAAPPAPRSAPRWRADDRHRRRPGAVRHALPGDHGGSSTACRRADRSSSSATTPASSTARCCSALAPRPTCVLVKRELFTGLLGWFLPLVGQIPVDPQLRATAAP